MVAGRLRALAVVEAAGPGGAGELAGVGEDGDDRARRSRRSKRRWLWRRLSSPE
jgi:hypothetical protein